MKFIIIKQKIIELVIGIAIIIVKKNTNSCNNKGKITNFDRDNLDNNNDNNCKNNNTNGVNNEKNKSNNNK